MVNALRTARPVLWVALIVLALILAVPGGLLIALALNLPTLDDFVTSPDVHGPLTIRRDAQGIVAVAAASQRDAAWAIGYAHAQDRLFQMDLMRRTAAGELSEVFGSRSVGADIATRRWQLRSLAKKQLAGAREDLALTIRAYTAGVNAGIDSLKLKPLEYILLRADPRPWREEDCLLVIHAMFLSLTDPGAGREQFLAELKHSVSPEIFAFISWSEGDWDSSFVENAAHRPAPGIPAAQPNLSANPLRERSGTPLAEPQRVFPGSSSWAVSGRRTKHPQGLLGVDMHLALSVPNVWYRAEAHIDAGPGSSARRSVYGLTLPGFPGFIVGSNQKVAWGLSNTQGDWADLLVLKPCESGAAPGYQVDSDCEPFRASDEVIKVAHGADVVARILTTRWGPLIDSNRAQQPVVHRWLGDILAATNLRYLDLIDANDVAGAIEIARASGMPPVNFVAADSSGHIGWTIAGQLPDRHNTCPIDPQQASTHDVDEWQRFTDPGMRLRVIDPPAGYLVTANQRILPDADAPLLCDGAYQLGARALQIERSLSAATALDERTAMQIQLDDRAVLLERWRELLVRVIADRPDAGDTRYETLLARLTAWDGHASADSVAYRFIREFREALSADILGILAQHSGLAGYELFAGLPQAEYPVWKMIDQQPADWLPEGFDSWHGYIRSVLDRVLSAYELQDPQLTQLTWGKRNVLDMRNVVLSNLPLLGRYFGMDAVELPGDTHMPRVQTPTFGASQRLVVAPSREQDGILTMPGGQSSNPLSPFFAAGHEQWVKGMPMALVAGPARHEIRVSPTRNASAQAAAAKAGQ